jgi:hypothetical protein
MNRLKYGTGHSIPDSFQLCILGVWPPVTLIYDRCLLFGVTISQFLGIEVLKTSNFSSMKCTKPNTIVDLIIRQIVKSDNSSLGWGFRINLEASSSFIMFQGGILLCCHKKVITNSIIGTVSESFHFPL